MAVSTQYDTTIFFTCLFFNHKFIGSRNEFPMFPCHFNTKFICEVLGTFCSM